MKTKSIILGSLIGALSLAGSAYALQHQVNFNEPKGYFNCTVTGAEDSAVAVIASHHAVVRGPNCDGHGVIKLTAKEVGNYNFVYEVRAFDRPNAVIDVAGATHIVCDTKKDDKKPDAQGVFCWVNPANHS